MDQLLITAEMPSAMTLKELVRLAEQQDNRLAMRIAEQVEEEFVEDLQEMQQLGLGLAKEMMNHAKETVGDDLSDLVSDIVRKISNLLVDGFKPKLYNTAVNAEPFSNEGYFAFDRAVEEFTDAIEAMTEGFQREARGTLKHLVDPNPWFYTKEEERRIKALEGKYHSTIDSFQTFLDN